MSKCGRSEKAGHVIVGLGDGKVFGLGWFGLVWFGGLTKRREGKVFLGTKLSCC